MNYFILAGLCSQQFDWKGIIQYVLFSCFKSVLSFLCCFHFLWGNRQFSHLIINSWLSLHIWNQDCSCLSRRILMVWFPKCAGGHCCDNLMAGNDLDSVYKRGQSHRVPLAHIHFAAATDGCLPRSEWGGTSSHGSGSRACLLKDLTRGRKLETWRMWFVFSWVVGCDNLCHLVVVCQEAEEAPHSPTRRNRNGWLSNYTMASAPEIHLQFKIGFMLSFVPITAKEHT